MKLHTHYVIASVHAMHFYHVTSHTRMKKLGFYISVLFIIGCQGESEICGDLDGVDYVVNHYFTNMDKISHIEYYNSNNQLLRWWKPTEEIKNYRYDTEGKLSEIQYSRSCRSVLKHQYQLYNEEGHLIGEYTSRTPILNLDSVNQVQSKFYSKQGLLESEFVTENGKEVEKKYTYDNGELSSLIILNKNKGMIRSETYYYSESSLLDSTLVSSGGITSVEINKYDSANRLESRTIRSQTKTMFSNANFENSKITFDNHNHVRTYEYKDDGKITIERRIGNDGKSHLTIIKEKIIGQSKN